MFENKNFQTFNIKPLLKQELGSFQNFSVGFGFWSVWHISIGFVSGEHIYIGSGSGEHISIGFGSGEHISIGSEKIWSGLMISDHIQPFRTNKQISDSYKIYRIKNMEYILYGYYMVWFVSLSEYFLLLLVITTCFSSQTETTISNVVVLLRLIIVFLLLNSHCHFVINIYM